MASLTTVGTVPISVTPPGIATIQRALMWMAGVGGAIVFIEPSPYELVMLTALVLFGATGLRLRAVLIPLLLLLFLLNLGYTISSIPLLDLSEVSNWIMTSWYLAVTAAFFAMAMSDDTAARLDSLRRGLILGALIASIAGIAGYLRLVPGSLYELLTLYGRARGTFKDPNVLGAFLILPSLFLLQQVVTQSFWKSLRSAIALAVVALAVLLAFSRGSWGQLIACSVFLLILMYLTASTNGQRTRIVAMSVAAMVCAVLFVVILLSFDSIGELFRQRASLTQSYDVGRFGRFGRYTLGIDMALDLPFGIGPLQFKNFFPEDTHNSFLNAFMSGGWISGVCFPTLALITSVMGFRMVFVRVPWQRAYLAVFAAFLGTVFESAIIDVDHWRHFWMLLGMMWGLFVAAQLHIRRTPSSAAMASSLTNSDARRVVRP